MDFHAGFYATVVLIAAAFFGILIVYTGIRFRRDSYKLAIGHATLALSGVTLLALQIYQDSSNKYYNAAALLLVLAIIGGGMLFALRERGKPPVFMMVLLHAVFALSGLVVLLLAMR